MVEEYPIFQVSPGQYVITAYYQGNYGTGTPSASTTVDLGTERKVRFLSGSVAGGTGAATVERGGLTIRGHTSGSLAIGRVECKNAAGSTVALIGLPLLSPVDVNNVKTITLTVSQSVAAWADDAYGTTVSGSGCASVIFKVL